MSKQRSKFVIAALLFLVAAGLSVCYQRWVRRSGDVGDADAGSVIVGDELARPNRVNDTSRHRRVAMRRRLEAILDGKWVRLENDDEKDASVRGPFPGPCRIEIDEDRDGRPDRINRSIFDDEGKVTVEELDDDADGQVDRRFVHGYDETGKLTSIEENGEKHFNAERVFDKEGNALSEKIDFKNDGEIDVLVKNTYDEYGDLLTREMKSKISDDRSSFTYDEQGNLLTKNTRAFLHMNGKQENTKTRYVYDSDENLVEEIVTGDRSRTTVYTYDKDSNRLKKEVDDGSDGQADTRWKYRYDGAGNMLFKELDHDGDGTFDRHWQNSYDC